MPTKTRALLLIVLLASVARADDLTVTTAAVSPASALPGAPVWISFTVKNTSERAVAIPLAYAVEVTPQSGEPFLARQMRFAVARLPEEYKGVRELSPGESRTIDFVTGSDIGDGWIGDARLWNPGTYSLRLILHDGLRDPDLDRLAWSSLAGAGLLASPPLVTRPMELQVETLTGVDAAAWKSLMESTRGVGLLMNHPKGAELGERLWTQYRESRYAPYFGLAAGMKVLRTGGEKRFERLAELHAQVVAADRDGVLRDTIRLGLAQKQAYDAVNEPDAATAVGLASSVRAELETLAADSKHELTRLRARNEAAKLPTAQQIRERFARTQ
jgi:hypothetical protein